MSAAPRATGSIRVREAVVAHPPNTRVQSDSALMALQSSFQPQRNRNMSNALYEEPHQAPVKHTPVKPCLTSVPKRGDQAGWK